MKKGFKADSIVAWYMHGSKSNKGIGARIFSKKTSASQEGGAHHHFPSRNDIYTIL